MDRKALEQLFIDILKARITENFSVVLSSEISADDMRALYVLAKKQSLAQVVYSYLKRKDISISSELKQRYDNLEKLAIYRCIQMEHELNQLGEYFDQLEIPYIPLKGSVLRPFYPEEHMRTSNDIDVLIREQDIEKALTKLKEKGYSVLERTYHDISIITPSRIHLELHFSPLFVDDKQNDILKDAWANSERQAGHRFSFTNEFFVFHFFSHMATHFVSGGCGVRFLTDIWVIENKMKIPLDCADEMLKKANLYKFSQEMIKLTHICFGDGIKDEQSQNLISFMLEGGPCGSEENHIVAKMSQSKKASRFRFVMGRLFPRYKLMKEVYPILRKVPFLLPIFWIVRLFSKLKSGKTKSAAIEVKQSKFVATETVEKQKQMLKNLGLIE